MMNRQAAALSTHLTTICSQRPREIRAQVIDALQSVVPCDGGTFATCAESEGNRYFDGVVCTGDPGMVAAQLAVNGTPALRSSWNSEDLQREEINRFIRIRQFFADEYLFSFDVMKNLYTPLEVGDQLRAVLFDGSELIGWIGLHRRGDQERFSLREQQLLAEATPRVKTALAAAKALNSKNLNGDLCAVFTARASIEHASRDFVEWLTPHRRSYLNRWVRGFDAGTDEAAIKILAGAEVRFVRLDGRGGVRYMATVERAQLVELAPDDWLTPRQREVADYAAAGATSQEIAKTLGISVHTVNDHIKAIYERLGIASRAELAALMVGG
jgi:DNA-binding CsgD family transcriptional regulator